MRPSHKTTEAQRIEAINLLLELGYSRLSARKHAVPVARTLQQERWSVTLHDFQRKLAQSAEPTTPRDVRGEGEIDGHTD